MSTEKKSQRMQPVQALADRQEQEEATRYAAVQQQYEAQSQKLDELKQYYEEYRRAAADSLCDVKRLQESRAFLSRLSLAIRQQSDSVERCREQLRKIRQEWMKARQHSRSMDQLIERYRADERRDEARREQSVSDELSSQRFVWQRRQQQSLS